MLEIENSTLFQFFTYETEIVDHRPASVVIVAGTFAIRATGDCELATIQEPIQLEAIHYPSNVSKGVFRESDVVPFKHGGDLTLVNAFSMPPGGMPKASWQASIRTYHLHVEFDLMGPSKWYKSFGKRILSRPEKIDRLQLVDENTYGGSYETANGPRFELENIWGCGVSCGEAVNEPDEIKVPQILFDKTELRFRKSVKPVCFGPVPGTVPFRSKFAGTYDTSWRQSRWPRLPSDFDLRYYSHSPDWLRHPRPWSPGDEIDLQGIGSNGRFIARVPEVEIAVLIHLHNGKNQFSGFLLDTLEIDVSNSLLRCVWRTHLEEPSNIARLQIVAVSRE